METTTLFYRFGAALVIGVLVGLQREYAEDDHDKELFAGVRTFALMSLIGCTAALAADILDSPGVFIGILLLLGALTTVAYFVSSWRGQLGMTTETAALMTTLIGALCYWDQLPLAVAIGVATTVLLSIKLEMKRFVRHITREDIYATLKFAVITAIILPVLPNQSFAPPPFDVLNPYRIWLMVVLISGISFLGYLLIKLVGPRQGIGLTGLLGGLVSSTAVTLSFSQRSHKEAALSKPFALAITVSWTVMFLRVVVEVAVLNRKLLQILWLPLAIVAVVGLAYCVYLYFSQRVTEKGEVSFSNPFELGPAVQFGLLYALILVISQAAQQYLGDTGLYVSSIAAGLTDVDAITLSMAELSQSADGVSLDTAAQASVPAVMS